jgi:protein-L-isoaspartate(D-aspartate) O-methyltransferase
MDANNDDGQVIGNYRLVEKLDCGGFGCVYRAVHLHLKKRTVVIKLLHTDLASQQKIDEFLQEAQFLEELKHPNILPILDVGVFEKKIPYLVLEYCPNGSLKEYLRRQHGSPLKVEEAVSILTKIGQALQHAHHHSIVHRDLKPANILFNAKGEVVLTDFGIAVLLESTTFINRYGTPAYMAPEQFQGVVSKKSDQFALGCIAYELVTGERPFRHSRSDPPIPPSTLNPIVPPHIERTILKALAEGHNDRYEDIVTFINALEETAQQWLDEGRTFYRLQKFEEALAAFEQAIRLDPNYIEAHQEKGMTLHNLKRYEEALEALEQVIRLDPNRVHPYLTKGNALNALKRYKEALTTFEQAIHLDPNLASAYIGKDEALQQLGISKEAQKQLESQLREAHQQLDTQQKLSKRPKNQLAQTRQQKNEALQQLIESLRRNGIIDESVLNTISVTPRKMFLHKTQSTMAFEDRALSIGRGQTISQPLMVATMTQALQLGGNERILEIGTGSGYQTAILSLLASYVYSIECIQQLACLATKRLEKLECSNVTVFVGDGTLGWPDQAPYDCILVTAAAPEVSERLYSQLVMWGKMVIPVGGHKWQELLVIHRAPWGPEKRSLGKYIFEPLVGVAGWSE